ncbi:MAG: ferredoxin-type protein NapG, partial [Deltaproteobacteria bacterium]|nr:ferredoxin-type protein NapG [Deltaproteobacteria bacterium]
MPEEQKENLPIGVKGAVVGGAAVYLLFKAGAGYGWMLRPPGAVTEEEFLKKCLRCGRCAHVCPY